MARTRRGLDFVSRPARHRTNIVAKIVRTAKTDLLDGLHQLRVSLRVKLVAKLLKRPWPYSIIRSNIIKGGAVEFVTEEESRFR